MKNSSMQAKNAKAKKLGGLESAQRMMDKMMLPEWQQDYRYNTAKKQMRHSAYTDSIKCIKTSYWQKMQEEYEKLGFVLNAQGQWVKEV